MLRRTESNATTEADGAIGLETRAKLVTLQRRRGPKSPKFKADLVKARKAPPPELQATRKPTRKRCGDGLTS